MGAEISAIDRTKYEASYKDNRIVATAAIEPGLTWGLTASDVARLDVPVLLIGLGQGKDRLEATDTSATGSNFEALVPTAKVEHIAPAMHFTALGICKPAGETILIEEKDDPVCTDPAGTDRKAVLNKIIELLAEHFKLN
jgi:predicted dienelactone hydrolase